MLGDQTYSLLVFYLHKPEAVMSWRGVQTFNSTSFERLSDQKKKGVRGHAEIEYPGRADTSGLNVKHTVASPTDSGKMRVVAVRSSVAYCC
jgi:hypothetical protein